MVEKTTAPITPRSAVNLRPNPVPAPRPPTGFVRHDLYLAGALLLLSVAVVAPQAAKHGLKGALLACLGLAGLVAAAVLVFLALVRLLEAAQETGTSRTATVARLLGLGLRFLLFGLIATALAQALVLWHGLRPALETGLTLGAGAAGGAGACFLHLRLGPPRFWGTFRRLCFAMVGSLFGGILGLLVPGPWGKDLGILVPLLVFGSLAAAGRIVPPLGISVSSPPHVQ